jgi:hypothetical protein
MKAPDSRYPHPLPDYAVDLLMSAKCLLAVKPEDYHHAEEALDCAVEAFENQMPLWSEGEIFTEFVWRAFLRQRGAVK